VQYSSDVTVLVDATGAIRYASPAVEWVLGYRPEELLGVPVFAGLAEPDAERLRAHGRAVLTHAAHAPVQEVRVRHRDGSLRTLEIITTNRLADPEVAGIIINAWDVTRRTLAEQRLQFLVEATASLSEPLELDTILQRLTELAVPYLADWCAIDLVTEAGAIERVAIGHASPERAALLEELEQRYPRDWQADFGVAQVLRTGTVAFYPDISTVQPTADRDAAYHEIMNRLAHRSYLCVPLMARGTTIGAMTFVAAESQRRYELADVGLAQALARRVALAVENARLYDRAQTALAVRNQFLAVISHDLRQPLAVFRGAGELLHERVNQLGDAEATWLAMRVERAAARTEAMINELVDIASLQRGQALPLVLHRTNLVTLVKQLVADLQQGGSHSVHLQVVGGRLLGRWDIARIERVVSNLLANALKYSPEGSPITVTLHRVAGRAGGRSWAVVEIADEGIGIPAADRGQVFDLFHRGQNVIGQVRGLGIGLAGAKQIIDQHGGQLRLASWEHIGTVMTVCLPLSVPQAAAQEPHP
jgi:PAS domain S-box-containing protein